MMTCENQSDQIRIPRHIIKIIGRCLTAAPYDNYTHVKCKKDGSEDATVICKKNLYKPTVLCLK